MGITTKGGDGGSTSLWSGQRVAKDDARVEAYGTVDELGSHLGFCRHAAKAPGVPEMLLEVQDDLFKVAGSLATLGAGFIDPLTDRELRRIEEQAAKIESSLGLQGFVITGATEASARIDVARTVCRRAERRIIALSREAELPDLVLPYMNRLSDFLFLLARREEANEGAIRYRERKAD
jgi:ATP:cob(I)alamin adenosyltransferase